MEQEQKTAPVAETQERLRILRRLLNANFNGSDFFRNIDITYTGHRSGADNMQPADCKKTSIAEVLPVLRYSVPEYDRKGIAVHNRLLRLSLAVHSGKSLFGLPAAFVGHPGSKVDSKAFVRVYLQKFLLQSEAQEESPSHRIR